MIEVRCLDSLAQAAPWRAEIDALNLASARPDPFSTFGFYENFLRNVEHFPAGSVLWLLLAFSDGRLVGYLPLKQSTQRVFGLRASRLDLLTAYQSDRPHVVALAADAAAVSAAIYAYLLGRRKDWALLEFQQQDAASALLPPPAAVVSGGFRFREWPNLENGTVTVRWTSIAGYFAALSKKFRSNVSRQMRSLLAAGDVQMLSSSDPTATGPLFELYRGIEPHSWKAGADAAISRGRDTVAYYSGLMNPAQPMRVGIQVLLLDGMPIAGLISGAFGNGLYALHIVYDDRLAKLGPGTAILLMGMRRAIEGGFERFNLLSGFGYYKTRWLAQMCETRSLQIYRTGTPFFWRRVLGDVLRRAFARAAGAAATFNPARRGVLKPVAESDHASQATLAGPQLRERYATLIALARCGDGEFLSAPQLAAVMPFATQREAA